MISERFKKLIPVLIGILFLANILAWIVVFDLSKPQVLQVSFLDVGQGDSIFIETPQHHQILIDGGPGSTVLEKLGQNMPFWDRTIDLIVLTHPEFDHMAGLIEVLKSYRIENVLWTGVAKETPEYEEWLNALQKENTKIIIATAGQKIKAGNIYLDVLYPFENLKGELIKDTNDTSIIARLVFGKDSFLFTGDASKSIEKNLVDRKLNLKSDVLKVSHHGSKTANYEKFIEEVLPQVAVIEVGKDNSYGHPNQETLETLEKYGIKIFRTDINGDVKIISDGEKFLTFSEN